MSKQVVEERLRKNDGGFDLVASASSGDWSVWIDETPAGPERIFAQLKGPAVYFSFELPSSRVIDELLRFLEQPAHKSAADDRQDNIGSISLGGSKGMPITLIRDSEYSDRYFLKMGAGRGPVVRYSFEGADLFQLKQALCQIRVELKAEGLL
jgi:hypothetical protein